MAKKIADLYPVGSPLHSAIAWAEDGQRSPVLAGLLLEEIERLHGQQVDALARIDVLENLLAHYRAGDMPSEKTHKELARTKEAVAAWR